jgi:hypothetical protein
MGPARYLRISWPRLLPWVLGAALLGALYVFEVPVCPSRRLLGLPCPGCGLTRAAVALVQLDWTAAFALHPMVFVALPLVGWLALHLAAGEARTPAPPAWVWIAAGIILVAVWLARLAGALGGHPDL